MEISRARDRAELVTDDAAELRAQLQAVTGERIAALEGIGEMLRDRAGEKMPDRGASNDTWKERDEPGSPAKERGRGVGMDLGL